MEVIHQKLTYIQARLHSLLAKIISSTTLQEQKLFEGEMKCKLQAPHEQLRFR